MEDSIGLFEVENQLINSETSKNINDLFQKGTARYLRGDMEKAAEYFQSITSINPNIPEPFVNLGNAYFNLNRVNEALDCWKKALALDENQVPCYTNIGNGYFALGNVNEAIYYWHVALSMAPDHCNTLFNLGAAYDSLNDKITAFKYFNLYLKYQNDTSTYEFDKIMRRVTDSKKIALHNIKSAIICQNKNDYRSAALAYVKSIKAYPYIEKAHLNLGSILYKAGNIDSAVNYWLKAIKVNPKNEVVYCNLGIAYDRLNQQDKAYCMYKRYFNVCKDPSSDSYEIEERINKISKYLLTHPEYARKHSDMAEGFYRDKKFFEALWEYENAVILDPKLESSFKDRIVELKNFINPESRVSKIAYQVGNDLMSKNKYKDALQAFKRALLLEPNGEFSREIRMNMSKCKSVIYRTPKRVDDE